MKKLKLTTNAEATTIWKEVAEWWDSGGKIMFEDSGGRAAVAEYIANRKGLTLFQIKVEESKERENICGPKRK